MHKAWVVALALSAGIVTVGCGSADIAEDNPKWDCRTMGNHVCGPDNGNHWAGLYFTDGDGVRLVKPWLNDQTSAEFFRSLDVNGDGRLSDIELGS